MTSRRRTLRRRFRPQRGGNIDQLVVYFAGHGVNIRYGEYWLLSGAPEDTQEAVNVEGSVVLARQSAIPHVVMISDACRTAAEGLQVQYVTGSEIFRNDGPGGPEQCVDLFFASIVGKPALEVRDPADSMKAYRALYTDALVDGLRGKAEPPLERAAGKGLVRPRPLKRYLSTDVARRRPRIGTGSPAISTIAKSRNESTTRCSDWPARPTAQETCCVLFA